MHDIQFDPSQFTILVAEDNATNMRLLIELLRDDGYQVQAARNGLQSVQIAEEMLPDLLLLDVMMPGLTGYEVCEILKKNPTTQRIPVIFISALAQVSDKIKAFELGAADYITKPFNTKEVIARIKSELIRRSHLQSLERKITTLEQTLLQLSDSSLSSSAGQKQWEILLKKLSREEALSQPEERWKLAFWANEDGVWDWDLDRNHVFYSSAWKTMLGYAEADIGNHPDEWRIRLHPEDRTLALTQLQDYIDGHSRDFRVEYRLRCKDDSYKWIFTRSKGIWNPQGRLVRMVGSHTDITRFKDREYSLQQEKEVAAAESRAKTEILGQIRRYLNLSNHQELDCTSSRSGRGSPPGFGDQELEELLSSLPPLWQQQFQAAARDADGEQLYALIHQMPSSHRYLAQILIEWVDRLQLDLLMNLLSSV